MHIDTSPPRPTGPQRRRTALIAAAWLGIIGLGLGRMMIYDFTPAAGATLRATDWPRGLPVALTPLPGRATLVVALHPLCPCSRATVTELAELVQRVGPRIQVFALFVLPHGLGAAEADPTQSALWKSVAAIPGVMPLVDRDGTIADRFGANSSGQVYVYDSAGRLRFSGGITAGRGLVGDNDGMVSIDRLLQSDPAAQLNARPTTTPVYGCPLQ